MNTTYRLIKPALLSLAILSSSVSATASLILHYDFDEISGNSVPDVSENGNGGTLSGTAANQTAGTGLSGQSGDYAFNNTASAMASSTSGTGGSVLNTSGLGELSSFTITMWHKTDSTLLSGARFLDLNATAAGGEALSMFYNNGKLRVLGVDSPDAAKSTFEGSGWVFVAVTFDGTADGGGVLNYYVGDGSSLVSLGSQSVAATAVDWGDSGALLTIGANTANGRALDGWIDDVRIYGANGSAAGALDLASLSTVYAQGLSGIPEPSSYATVAAVAVFAGVVVNRRRRVR